RIQRRSVNAAGRRRKWVNPGRRRSGPPRRGSQTNLQRSGLPPAALTHSLLFWRTKASFSALGRTECFPDCLNVAPMAPEVRTRPQRKRQRGQSLVEFAISSTVLLLLAMGLIDLSRAFYYSVSLQGAAREGARHGAWFNTPARNNNFLDDADVMTAVKQGLYGAGFKDSQINLVTAAGCLAPTDSNSATNKPYPAAAYPATSQSVNVYICYTDPNGSRFGTRPS